MNNREKKLLNRRPPAPTTVGTPTTVVTHQKTLNTNPSSSSSPSSCVHDDQKLVKQPSFSLTQSLQHILKDADSPIDKSSEHKLYDQLYSGIFLHHKTQACNSFLSFNFNSRNNENYWRWVSLEESNGTMIEVAELERVCWLEVHGRLDTRKFSPGILYEVSFHVMLKDTAQGWEVPINMRLVLPGGKIKQEHKENLKDKMRGSWMDIPVGQFIASDHGEIEFSMYEYDGGIWKSGLLIKGVSIKPNSDDYKLLKQPSLSLVQSLQHILKDADSPIDKSSEQKLYDQLYSGIFLHHKTQACKTAL
ncbi:protein PHLOEM PROTEIN 2-LIKE A1-like [Senna tora]|uniref:Protein PHLOEM PROTEIN 2-LIKE A1-like n=1 Tax=Senna tora TaxID=362788 RepID=A0A835CJI6_9FABA|nr:protein PHLOEM PROTEIN 2-LIKE A1-like [Senna tora]